LSSEIDIPFAHSEAEVPTPLIFTHQIQQLPMTTSVSLPTEIRQPRLPRKRSPGTCLNQPT
jgi:hypothetical protein